MSSRPSWLPIPLLDSEGNLQCYSGICIFLLNRGYSPGSFGPAVCNLHKCPNLALDIEGAKINDHPVKIKPK